MTIEDFKFGLAGSLSIHSIKLKSLTHTDGVIKGVVSDINGDEMFFSYNCSIETARMSMDMILRRIYDFYLTLENKKAPEDEGTNAPTPPEA